jgi:hypothetical protein
LGKVLNLLAAVVLGATPISMGDPMEAFIRPPAMNISAIRQIRCDDWVGTGFLIGPKIMATANHVMEDGKNCRDGQTGSALMTYKTDKKHDLVLVTGPGLPTDIPYIRYSCERFKPGEKYLAYGISNYMQNRTIIRNNVLTATKAYTPDNYTFSDGTVVAHARVFTGYQAPGMSGGPVADIEGYAHGLVTGGSGYESFHFEFADGILCK